MKDTQHGTTPDGRGYITWNDERGMPRATNAYWTEPQEKAADEAAWKLMKEEQREEAMRERQRKVKHERLMKTDPQYRRLVELENKLIHNKPLTKKERKQFGRAWHKRTDILEQAAQG